MVESEFSSVRALVKK